MVDLFLDTGSIPVISTKKSRIDKLELSLSMRLFYKKNSTQKDIDNIGQEGLFVNIYKEKGRANKTMYFL